MADDKLTMPSASGGIVRYFDDYKSKIRLKPGHVVVLAIVVVIAEIVLHVLG